MTEETQTPKVETKKEKRTPTAAEKKEARATLIQLLVIFLLVLAIVFLGLNILTAVLGGLGLVGAQVIGKVTGVA